MRCDLCLKELTEKEKEENYSCEVCEKVLCDECYVYRFDGYLVCRECYDKEVGQVRCEDCNKLLTREEIDFDDVCNECKALRG
jgi:hypothetical protein